ncbi:MAG: toll/interleukin-1 receptor domain-containing protein [Rhodospirillaceae bacterium]
MAMGFGSFGYRGTSRAQGTSSGAPISNLFISFSRDQADWVENQLVPVLVAGGADTPLLHAGGGEELVDTERSAVGARLAHQLLAAQDQAERQIVVLSKDYLANVSCLDQLRHALGRDADFRSGLVIPVRRDACPLPDGIDIPESLIIDMRNDRRAPPWDQLLAACRSRLGVGAVSWLQACDAVIGHVAAGRSVNLVIDPAVEPGTFLRHLGRRIAGLAVVDIGSPQAATRRGLISELLRAIGCATALPSSPVELELFDRALGTAPTLRAAVANFDFVARRLDFDPPLFDSLARAIAATPPGLVLVLQSGRPLREVMAPENPLMAFGLPVVTLAPRCP